MTHADELALWNVCEHQWTRLSGRWSVIRLPREEWKDIKSEAFIRVFQKSEQYNPLRGAPETWVAMVMRNAVFNSLRRHIPSKKSHVYRTPLRYARPLEIRVMETGRWGELTVVVEPDILDEKGVPPWRGIEVEEFTVRLSPQMKIIFRERRNGLNLAQIHRRHFRRRNYQWVHNKANQLKEIWKQVHQ